MKYKLFDGEIDSTPNGLTNSILKFLEEDGNLVIGLDSPGGEIGAAMVLLQALSTRNEQFNKVTLIGVNYLGSSAFRLFYSYRGPKLLTMNCIGMAHQTKIEVAIASNNKPSNDEGVTHLANRDIIFEDETNFAKKFMTHIEFEKFCDNKDIWFDLRRMREIFPDVKVISY